MEKFYNTFVETFDARPTSVLEIGSRDGRDAEKLRALSDLSCENVYVVEPHPESFRRIIAAYPMFKVFENAVTDIPGVVNFNALPSSAEPTAQELAFIGTSSLLLKNKKPFTEFLNMSDEQWERNAVTHWVKVLGITGRTLLQLIDRSEIDLVKIDVEGATLEVLKSFSDDIRLLKALHVEVEKIPLWENQHLYSEIHQYLTYYGFKERYYVGYYWGGNQGDNVWTRLS